MTDEELIKRPFDEDLDTVMEVQRDPVGAWMVIQEKANRIEELVKERDDLGRKLNTARYGQPDFAWSIHEEELADLRVKLAKAVEALVQLERIVGDILGAHLQDSESRDKAIDLIKTTLAELEGEKIA
jgi:hypothetical protein